MIVNFFAGPGAGKSTTAAALFTLLKLHEGIDCELVAEYAKDLVWEERKRTFEDQPYIFAKQQHRIWRVADKVDVVITDSPILLSNIYRRDETSESFKKMVREEFDKNKNMNFFIERRKKYNPKGRNETEEQAHEVDEYIRNYLSRNGIYYYAITGDMEGVNVALVTILGELGKQQKFELRKI